MTTFRGITRGLGAIERRKIGREIRTILHYPNLALTSSDGRRIDVPGLSDACSSTVAVTFMQIQEAISTIDDLISEALRAQKRRRPIYFYDDVSEELATPELMNLRQNKAKLLKLREDIKREASRYELSPMTPICFSDYRGVRAHEGGHALLMYAFPPTSMPRPLREAVIKWGFSKLLVDTGSASQHFYAQYVRPYEGQFAADEYVAGFIGLMQEIRAEAAGQPKPVAGDVPLIEAFASYIENVRDDFDLSVFGVDVTAAGRELAQEFKSDSRFVNILGDYISDELLRLQRALKRGNEQEQLKRYVFTEPTSLRKFK